MKLLDRLREHAERSPARVALCWDDRHWSYAALCDAVENAMQQLRCLDVRVVAIDLDNVPAWVILDIAAMALGICTVPLPPFFSPSQLRHVMRQTGAQGVLTGDPVRLCGLIGAPVEVQYAGFSCGAHQVAWVPAGAAAQPVAQCIPPGVDKVTFTSGTTGEPKGVMLSQAQMLAVSESLRAVAEITPVDRHLVLMPLAVLLENVAGVYATFCAGAQVQLMAMRDIGMSGSSGVDGMQLSRALIDAGATTAILTPQTLSRLVDAITRGAGLPKLRFAAVGGASVSPRLLQAAAQAGVPVYEGYGLSESGSVVCLNSRAAQRAGSVGRPLPHLELRISSEGEVVVRGQPFLGYLGAPLSAVAECRTGDLGELDHDGFLYLRGRRRDVFITAFGRNVAPEWVERELVLQPAIAQAAVFGEAKPFNAAIIVPAAAAGMGDVETAVRRCNRDLPDYARVGRWIVADTPFTAGNGMFTGNGRVRRGAVFEHYHTRIESLYREVQHS